MRVLIVETLYHYAGGPSVYAIKLAGLLEKESVETAPFAMQHPDNIPTPFDVYFPQRINYVDMLNSGIFKNSVKVLGRIFYNKEAKTNIDELIENFKPDIVHFNNYLHHLTVSVLEPVLKRNIPIIATLHDSLLICPNSNLFHDAKRQPCRKCDNLGKRMILPVVTGCKKSSRAASFVAGIQSMVFSLAGLRDKVDYFICPSNFFMENLKKHGFDESKLVYIPNFVGRLA
jgi:glycosyltransferase involved in cell wall biosynthesis